MNDKSKESVIVDEADLVDMPDEGVAPSSGTNDISINDTNGEAFDEVDILRAELDRLQSELSEAQSLADENKNKWLRSRAELDNYRRRAAQDVERARESGMDSALLTVMSVYDDLGRALKAADDAADPSTILPGVRSVRDSLERNLDTLGLKKVGEIGEAFNPDFHEALTALPTENPQQAGTIADVFEIGFVKGERLVRPARVVVYQG